MTAKGQPVFDALALGTLSADFTSTSVALTARAAFINTSTGATHGWTDGSGGVWSPQTMDRLRALAESMEEDLAKKHFGEASPAAAPDSEKGIVPSGGLSEHLGKGGDAPQI